MSEIRATTISDAAGTGPITLTKQSAAKAWVRANVSGVALNSFNVSSVSDTGAGTVSAALASAMSSVDTVVTASINAVVSTPSTLSTAANANTMYVGNYVNSASQDPVDYFAQVHGDLA